MKEPYFLRKPFKRVWSYFCCCLRVLRHLNLRISARRPSARAKHGFSGSAYGHLAAAHILTEIKQQKHFYKYSFD